MSGNASPLPPAFSQSAPLPPAFQQPQQHAGPPSEWARAVMPDGREVPDRTSSLDPGGGDPAPLLWRTESSKLQKTMLPKLAALVAVLLALVAYYGSRAVGADAAGTGIAIGVTFLIGFVALYFGLRFALRRQISGEGSISVMYLPPPFATPDAAGRLVWAAAGALGRNVKGPSTLRGVTYWDLDVAVRFYLNPMFGPSKTFLSIKTGSRENADLYRRLKGQILAQVAPPPPP